MGRNGRHHLHTLDAYLAHERTSPDKHEYSDGQILVMAGGSPRHNYVAGRVVQVLGPRLDGGPCFVLTSEQRLATPDGLYTYADAFVFCGPIALGPESTALNPVVVFEVLSPSTRDYDRGEKLERYKGIPSLRQVVLIEPHVVDVEVWTRGADGWTRRVSTDAGDIFELEGIGACGPVGELYAGSERLPT